MSTEGSSVAVLCTIMKWSEMFTLILLPATQERDAKGYRLPELRKCAKLV